MASQNRTEAYDFALFEPKRRRETPEKRDNIIRLPKEKLESNHRTKTNPIRAVSGFLALAVILGIVGTMVYGQVQMTELTDELNSATRTLDESRSVYTQMKMKSDSQLSLRAVESYATDKLGMKKIDQNQVVPIALSTGDKSQVVAGAEKQSWLDSLWNAIERFLS